MKVKVPMIIFFGEYNVIYFIIIFETKFDEEYICNTTVESNGKTVFSLRKA